MTHNDWLGEVAEIEAQMFSFTQKFNRRTAVEFCTEPAIAAKLLLGAGFYFIYVNLLVFMSTIISSVIEINLFSICFDSFSKSLKFGLSISTVSRIEY
jgi:hypothetical protein